MSSGMERRLFKVERGIPAIGGASSVSDIVKEGDLIKIPGPSTEYVYGKTQKPLALLALGASSDNYYRNSD